MIADSLVEENRMSSAVIMIESPIASPDFRAYRLRHYDFQGSQFGSRSSRVAWDAVSLTSIGAEAIRKSVVVNWKQIVGKDIDSILGAPTGAVLIIIPSDVASLSESDKKVIREKTTK